MKPIREPAVDGRRSAAVGGLSARLAGVWIAGLTSIGLLIGACSSEVASQAVPLLSETTRSVPSTSSSAPTSTTTFPVTTSRTTAATTTAPPTTNSPVPTTSQTRPDTTSSPTATATSPTPIAPNFPDVGIDGVNSAACTSEHRPVILLPGTLSTVAKNYRTLARVLIDDGFCVYGVNFGADATQAVRTSAQTTADFIRNVRAATGSEQVDVVGYSQGGLVLRTAMRFYGSADSVRNAVLIAPAFHGSDSFLLKVTADLCPACGDMRTGSALLKELAVDGDLDGEVTYSVISSALDDIVTPYQSQAPEGPSSRVHQIVIQDRCPDNRTPHGELSFDPTVVGWTVQSLEADGLPQSADLQCLSG